MCYAGGPYCYGDMVKQLARSERKVQEEKDTLIRMANMKGSFDEEKYREQLGKFDQAERDREKTRKRLHNTREQTELMQSKEFLMGGIDYSRFMRAARLRDTNSLALRKEVASLTGQKLSAEDNYALRYSDQSAVLVYKDEDGKRKQKSYQAGEQKSMQEETQRLVKQSEGRPFNQHIIYSEEGEMRGGTLSGDGLGNVNVYTDNHEGRIPVIKNGEPSQWNTISAYRETQLPVAPIGSVAKKYSTIVSQKGHAASKQYAAMEEANPSASLQEKELRARVLYYRHSLSNHGGRGNESDERRGTLYQKHILLYKQTDDYEKQREQGFRF